MTLAAAKLANCEEFAEKLPDKRNTNIGENGFLCGRACQNFEKHRAVDICHAPTHFK